METAQQAKVALPLDATPDQMARVAAALNNITMGAACQADWKALNGCFVIHDEPGYRPECDAMVLTIREKR